MEKKGCGLHARDLEFGPWSVKYRRHGWDCYYGDTFIVDFSCYRNAYEWFKGPASQYGWKDDVKLGECDVLRYTDCEVAMEFERKLEELKQKEAA